MSCPASDINSILWIMLELADKAGSFIAPTEEKPGVQVEAKPESYMVGIFDTYEVTLHIDWIKPYSHIRRNGSRYRPKPRK